MQTAGKPSYYDPEGETIYLSSPAASEAGVRVLFGRAPWLWQQHALLHAEKMARFEPDHHHDFNEIAWMAYGRDSFAAWIDGPPRPDGVEVDTAALMTESGMKLRPSLRRSTRPRS